MCVCKHVNKYLYINVSLIYAYVLDIHSGV